MADVIISNPFAYDVAPPFGITFAAYAVTGVPSTPPVDIELTPTDTAFMLMGFISRWGLVKVLETIGTIAEYDPTGSNCLDLTALGRTLGEDAT